MEQKATTVVVGFLASHRRGEYSLTYDSEDRPLSARPRRPRHLVFARDALAYTLQRSDCMLQLDDASRRGRHSQYAK